MFGKIVTISLVGLVVAAASGCSLLGTADDGSSCSESRECRSKTCANGYCVGSSCAGDDDDACQGGWVCAHRSADVISSTLGEDGSDVCVATCGHCPDDAYCPDDGKDDETECIPGTKP